jgi:hypothetical protein
MTNWSKMLVFALFPTFLVQHAFAQIDIQGILVGLGPTVVTGVDIIPGTVRTPAVFKVRVRAVTNGKVVGLCLGPPSDWPT